MTNRRLLIFQEVTTPSTGANPLTPSPHTPGLNSSSSQFQTQYTPVNKLGLPISGPGSLPEGLGVGSLLSLPLRVIMAFTEIFNGVKYKGWSIVAAGPYNDPTLGVSSPGGTGKFYAVVLEQVGGSSGAGSGGDVMGS
ncbi:hypothetical protein BJY04DRAFT_224657 [Aspergillus karnatakaensis]|uniref:uncharacterized protein n=1 Tax=Aspergillus karnatakaensis TaxID=1810916 RepID=UPI003CCCF1F4